MSLQDTITAIGTPWGEGGIGIIRISGNDAFKIAAKLFKSGRGGKPGLPKSRYLNHGYIVNDRDEVLDEVLMSFMQAPRTYTREDTVEINCHSGVFTLKMILDLVLQAGARLAEPGEFTRRAFINGRIDLSQAESILKIIRARSEQAVKNAARNLGGKLSRETRNLREKILRLLARIEATLDFPEDLATDPDLSGEIVETLSALSFSLREMIQGAERGRLYQEGVETAIVGKPNVGKSSLLNAMLRQQRAIVHEIPGTTRDLLEGYLLLKGYPLRLIDTAGIHRTRDPVEKEGIERTRTAATGASLLLIVLDGSTDWEEADEAVAGLIEPEKLVLFIVNKTDLKQKLNLRELGRRFPGIAIVETAVIKNKGIEKVEETVVALLDRELGYGGENALLVSMRHEAIIREALQHIDDALAGVDVQPLELVSMDLHSAWSKLGEITGETVSDALLDRIFSEFCLGK